MKKKKSNFYLVTLIVIILLISQVIVSASEDYIDNGDFSSWPRGTEFLSEIGRGVYHANWWYSGPGLGGQINVSRQNFTQDGINNLTYFLRIAWLRKGDTTFDSTFLEWGRVFSVPRATTHTVRKWAGKTVELSWRMRFTFPGGARMSFRPIMWQSFGTSSPTQFRLFQGQWVGVGPEWQTFNQTFNLPSVGPQDIIGTSNDDYVGIGFDSSGLMGIVDITGIQIKDLSTQQTQEPNMTDSDNDNVPDAIDRCPNQTSQIVNRYGCPLPIYNSFSPELTTNLSDVDITRLRNFRIGVRNIGQIDFGDKEIKLIENISNVIRPVNLNQAISFAPGKVIVRSELLAELNKSATVTIFNVPNLTNVIIKKDGVICIECRIINYAGGAVTFSVPHFTEYSVDEGNFCGDSFCSSQETCSSCSNDCGSCPIPGGGGSSAGGGGSSGGDKKISGTTSQTNTTNQTVETKKEEKKSGSLDKKSEIQQVKQKTLQKTYLDKQNYLWIIILLSILIIFILFFTKFRKKET